MRSSEADGINRIGSLIVHSWPVQTAGGALIAVLIGWAATLYLNRKRVAWRAYLDERIKPSPTPGTLKGLEYTLTIDKEKIDNPQLVLLRVRNAGLTDLEESDFRLPLTFAFPGRRVRGVEVSNRDRIAVGSIEWHIDDEPSPGDKVPDLTLAQQIGGFLRTLLRGRGRAAEPRTAAEPGSPQVSVTLRTLNRRARFTLLVVLSERDPGQGGKKKKKGYSPKIAVSGQLFAGEIEEESARFGPSTRSLFFGAMAVLPLVGLLVGLFLSPATPAATADAMLCPKGSLQLVGSTAFATAARAVAGQYEQACQHASTITVSGSASTSDTINGLNTLVQAGPGARVLAMSDGPAPVGGEYARLVGSPVGVIIFTLVDNRDTEVYNLSTAQVRRIFAGQITNWDQLGGANLPVAIISRYPGSGSRRAFDQYVLGGTEPQASSYSCTDKDEVPAAPQILCQQPDTGALLHEVAQVPGAIGYAETGDVATAGSTSVEQVVLNGLDDTYANLGSTATTYQFWTVEYLYSYGTPSPGSLAASFLTYLTNETAKLLVGSYGYYPCLDKSQKLAPLCSPSAR